MVDKLAGYYKLNTTENGDAYMKAVNIGYLTRKGAALVTIYLEIKVDDDGKSYHLNYLSSFKNQETKFELGKSMSLKTGDGRSYLTTFEVEDGKLLQKETMDDSKNVPSLLTYELENENTILLTAKPLDDRYQDDSYVMKRRFVRHKK